ncbi:MAG: 50S ribosome-binding GTPase [Rubritepida sp.]|nr:50S ribosome-binding GTPase [Rubritepida sp.]
MTWLRRFWPEILLAVLLALPWLAVFALGFVWLWQNGRVIEFALASALLLLAGLPLRAMVRRRAEGKLAPDLEANPHWDAEEQAAWAKVQALAEATPILAWDESERAGTLFRETVALVATHFHPREEHAIAHVTLPEALLLGELVSRRMRRWVLENMPFPERMRLSWVLWAKAKLDRYGTAAQAAWRVGEPLWRAWRFARNPPAAAAQEVTRALSGQTTGFLDERLRRVGTQELILMTGRTAIDLYAGRLKRSAADLAMLMQEDAAQAEAEPPPRLLLAGGANAGKTSLLNALAGTVRAPVSPLPSRGPVREHLVATPGRPALIVADMPALDRGERFLAEAKRADMILWMAPAAPQSRREDLSALAGLRVWAGGQRRKRVPALLVAMTGCDRLPGATFPESPPVRAAVVALAEALEVPEADVIPLGLPEEGPPWNLEALWARLAAGLPAARIVRAERLHEQDHRPGLFTEAGRLARGVGRTTRRLFSRRAG